MISIHFGFLKLSMVFDTDNFNLLQFSEIISQFLPNFASDQKSKHYGQTDRTTA